VAASLLVSSDPIETGEGPVHSQFETVRIPFIVVMALFSIVVTLKGLVVGARRGCLGPCAVTQRIVAGLVLITYVTAGFFFRFVPGAFGS